MDTFSYLSVLLSIILGLAITQVLQGFRALLLARSRVRLFAPSLIWAGLVLLMATQSWWASFGLADHDRGTFAEFAVVLLQLVLLYMVAGLVLPDLPPGEPIDLQAHYWREAWPLLRPADRDPGGEPGQGPADRRAPADARERRFPPAVRGHRRDRHG